MNRTMQDLAELRCEVIARERRSSSYFEGKKCIRKDGGRCRLSSKNFKANKDTAGIFLFL